MNLARELERLAKLHAKGALTAEEFTKALNRLVIWGAHRPGC
jgi:hypothetical protein